MLAAIREYFETHLKAEEAPREGPEPLVLATAALMFEIMRADDALEASEREQFRAALRENFPLDDAELDHIEALAEKEVEDANDLYQFTTLINEHYGPEERIGVIRNLWRVAFADGNVDRFEEHLIRRVADLLHVRHRDFIAAKLDVRGDA